MQEERKKFYEAIEKERCSKLLVYVTGDKAGWETQIANDATDYITEHLDKIGVVPKISLFLFTNGGNTFAGWNIVNLIRQFCDDFEIIVPNKARSTGTLMCLGANPHYHDKTGYIRTDRSECKYSFESHRPERRTTGKSACKRGSHKGIS